MRAAKTGEGSPAWEPAQAGRQAGAPPERTGLGAGPGRQAGRRTKERAGQAGVHPGGPAWEPAQAGRKAGGPSEKTGR